MTDVLDTTQTKLLDWTQRAIEAGWLAPEATASVSALNAATPSQLFDSAKRPLVVGFFGGTGVGKSSLLNRLAGEAVARASAERPTSTDITAYVHSSVRVDRLPDDFPMEKLRTAVHHNEHYSSVLWLDMPDFDSVETTHRALVEQWLPYIDVLVYVVSPERYRDDEGWRLLQQHGGRHAWLFVMNHWDRGDPVQRDDFTALLQSAGLAEPLLFCTDCNPHAPALQDDFAAFDEAIRALANEQLIGELEKHGVLQRLAEIQQVAEQFKEALGDAALIERWQTQWRDHWKSSSDELTQALQWQIPTLADSFVEPQRTLLLRWLPGARSEPTKNLPTNPAKAAIAQLIDDITLQRVDDAVAAYVHDARTEPVHTEALNQALARRRRELPARLNQSTQQALLQSLQRPGQIWQRWLNKGFTALATLLPLAVMGWVSYRLVNRFTQGGQEAVQYLGVNFAVHSLLLIALAWAIPTVLQHRTRPSRKAAAARGLTKGLEEALIEVDEQIKAGIEQAGAQREQLLTMWLTSQSDVKMVAPTARSAAVERLLIATND